jgi:hypothetical protein
MRRRIRRKVGRKAETKEIKRKENYNAL